MYSEITKQAYTPVKSRGGARTKKHAHHPRLWRTYLHQDENVDVGVVRGAYNKNAYYPLRLLAIRHVGALTSLVVWDKEAQTMKKILLAFVALGLTSATVGHAAPGDHRNASRVATVSDSVTAPNHSCRRQGPNAYCCTQNGTEVLVISVCTPGGCSPWDKFPRLCDPPPH